MAIVVPIVSSWNPKGLDKAIKDIKNAEGTFNKLGRTADIVSASLVQTGKSLTRNVTVPLLAVGVAMNKTVTDASNLAEAQSKVTAVFGAQAVQVQKWSKTMAASFGVSSRQALEAAGTYGNLFQAFGIGQTEARKMSTRMVELAADMASFNNVGIDEALTALRSGLSGETEPLKRFGVALLDVRLKEQALAMGLINTTSGVLPPAIKAQAAYALILKDTSLQQGDVARTAEGLANQKKFLAAQVEDLSGSFGAVLMPVMINVVGVIRNQVLPSLQKFIEAFKTLSPQAITTAIQIGIFAAALGPAMIMTGYMIKMLKLLGDAFMFVTKRIIFIPTLILLIAAAFVKGNDATMSWGDAVFKLIRGIIIGFVQVANAISTVVNVFIKGYNKFQEILDSGVRIQEWGNADFLIRGIDDAGAAWKRFTSELSSSQSDVSSIVAESKNLANIVGGSGATSVAGGVDKASDALDGFKTRLDEAKQVLTDAKNKFDDFAKSISGTIRSVLNFGTAANSESGTFIENIVGQANKAKGFGEKIRKLIGMGLSESALREVLDAGAEAGTKIADEIIAGGATVVEQVNTLLAATQSLADEIGLVGANQFYDAGVKQGEALVQGVVDAIRSAGFIIDEAGNISNPNAISAPVSTGGGAPSTGSIGKAVSNTGKSSAAVQGVLNKLKNIPMMANGGIVNSPTLAMIGEAGPEAVVPLSRMGKSGATYNINVNAGMGANGAQIGKEIVDAIKRYERSSGPVFASA